MIDTFQITLSSQRHIQQVAMQQHILPYLRISVNSGGCSGFQYNYAFESKIHEDDHAFNSGDVKILIDPMSWPFLMNCELDYVEDLMGSSFTIKNPNARSGCGCGSSFSV